MKRDDAAALAAIAAAYAILAARSAPAAAAPPSRWRLAGRPSVEDVALARNVSGGSRWSKAGRGGG